jgi:hypothetical protein
MDEELTEKIYEIYRSRGIPSDWEDMTPEPMRPAYRLWFRALPSPRSGFSGSDEAEELIHDPLTALRRAGVYEGDDLPDISTHVIGHQHTLNRMVMYAMVTISNNPHTVGITLVKEPLPLELRDAESGEASQSA